MSVGGIYAANAPGNGNPDSIAIPALGRSVWLYAPTHLPSATACYEATIAHTRMASDNQTWHSFNVWDWCQSSPNWVSTMYMHDNNFRSKYVRTYSPSDPNLAEAAGEVFYAQVGSDTGTPTSSCWMVLIYNFSTGLWEQISPSTGWRCGTGKAPDYGVSTGWTMWESEDLFPSCPSIRDIRAADIMVLVNNMWRFRQSGDYTTHFTGSPCWSGTYSFHSHAPTLWRAHTFY